MRVFVVGWVLGIVALQRQAELPTVAVAGLGLAALLAAFLPRRPSLRLAGLAVASLLLGFGYAAWRGELRLADALPFALEGRDVEVVGVVASLPQHTAQGVRFLLRRESGEGVPALLALAWYEGAPRVVPGQRWRFTLRLKRPRGLANPFGFDFEPWALQRGIRATGYVRAKPAPALLAERVAGWPQTVHRWRGEIREAMRGHLGDARAAGMLVALAIGDQDAIPTADWDTFWRTGVGHLMSISGLHITMLAALGFALARFAWVRIPALALRWPARKAAVVAGTLVAIGYAVMTGFAIPAQRTCLMLAVLAACVLADRHGSASRVLALAALAVTLADPWAVLTPGFWLSFGAVAAIFYVMALRSGKASRWRAALAEQAAVTAMMVPLLLALFQELSLVSPLANALAIPVVSLAIVPLVVAGAFLHAHGLLDVAHVIAAALMAPLEALADGPFTMLELPMPDAWAVAASILGCAWLLAPRGVPTRWLGAVWMLPLACLAPERPATGTAWVDVLDVGNGLAVVVRTATHALAYDAGPAWGGDSDGGGRIVVPHLRATGVRTLDGLVVSHADDDHAGGAISLAAAREPAWLRSPLPADHGLHGMFDDSRRCRVGDEWTWDGVRFAILHPGEGTYRKENDRSCVLHVRAAGASMLLTGDVEARAESEMLGRDASALAADVLLVPHHGSRSSSTSAFLDAVGPSLAVVSAGYRNRFGHPHALVLTRLAQRRVPLHRTDREGALRVQLPAESGAPPTVERLVTQVRYWSDRRPPP